MQHYKRLRNFNNLKKLIFPKISDDKLSQLMIDNESIKYITFHSVAQDITNLIMNSLSDGFPAPDIAEPKVPTICADSRGHRARESPEMRMLSEPLVPQHPVGPPNQPDLWSTLTLSERMSKLVITEMTAGVGGNVLNFANHFQYVNAIEIDKTRYTYLNQNIKLYGLTNVNTYHNDAIKLLIKQNDLVQDIIFFDPPWGGKDYKLHHNLRLSLSEIPIETICKKLFERVRTKMIVIKLPNNYDYDWFGKELHAYTIEKYPVDRMTVVILKNYLPIDTTIQSNDSTVQSTDLTVQSNDSTILSNDNSVESTKIVPDIIPTANKNN